MADHQWVELVRWFNKPGEAELDDLQELVQAVVKQAATKEVLTDIVDHPNLGETLVIYVNGCDHDHKATVDDLLAALDADIAEVNKILEQMDHKEE